MLQGSRHMFQIHDMRKLSRVNFVSIELGKIKSQARYISMFVESILPYLSYLHDLTGPTVRNLPKY